MGWIRRDAVLADASAAAFIAVAPLDLYGPVAWSFDEPLSLVRVSAILVVAACLLADALWSSRRTM